MMNSFQSKSIVILAQLLFIFPSFVLCANKITGTNAKEICTSFEYHYFPSTDTFKTSCSCNKKEAGNSTSYDVICKDKCDFCFDDICGRFSLTAKLGEKTGGDNNEFEMTYLKYCTNYLKNHFDGVELCNGYDYVAGEELKHEVDGDACASSSLTSKCADGSLGWLIDCSNLGYGSTMNLCEKSDKDGQDLFDHFQMDYEWSELKRGKCYKWSGASSLRGSSVLTLLSSIAFFTALSLVL